MDYVREHIKRYWGMSYRRTLGISLITFSVAISIGIAFTILTQNLATTSYISYLIFWLILLGGAILFFLANFFLSHTSSVRFMREEEHRIHSRHMGIWMISLVLGVVLFSLPLLFVNYYTEPIVLLFSLGCIFIVGYGTISTLFKHRYTELMIGGVAFFVMFFFSMYELGIAQMNIAAKANFSVYVAIMSITIIFGFVGIAMLFNSAKESMREFVNTVERIERDERIRKPKAARTAARKRHT